jgi:simple sugar transport system ATP-binding protein
VDKHFGELAVLAEVTFGAGPGEIHALIGENGAGKTTLVRILAGLERADSGMIEVAGTRLSSHPSPREAQAAGVGLVPQHCEVVPGLSVLENLALGREVSRHGVLRGPEARAKAQEIAERLGFSFRWTAPAESLGLGERQRLELLKMLWRDSSVVVFDEPTTVLTEAEVSGLFEVMRRLAGAGATVIFITHKLDEVRQIADDVTVLRRGRVVARVPRSRIDERELARAMIGEVVSVPVSAEGTAEGDVRLSLRNVSTTASATGDHPIHGIDLELRAGEVVGVAGIDGNGQTELYEVILGLRGVSSGALELDGRALAGRSVAQRRASGIASIPPDRMQEGVDRLATLWENAAAPKIAGGRATRWGVLQRRDLRAHALQMLDRAGVRGSLDQAVGALSGGNIQRLIVGRELDESPRVLVAAHPSRGVDVRGIAFIHERLLELRANGCAILMFSADLDELAQLAGRVVVMAGGRIVGEYVPDEADAAEIGLMMSGAGRR